MSRFCPPSRCLPIQVDLAVDAMGQADTPDITLACFASLRRRGILVLVGSMACPLPINHGVLFLPPEDLCKLSLFGCSGMEWQTLDFVHARRQLHQDLSNGRHKHACSSLQAHQWPHQSQYHAAGVAVQPVSLKRFQG